MPELPEVETIRVALDPLLRGRTVVESDAHPSPKFSSAPAAVGAEIGGVRRRGKYLLADLVGGEGTEESGSAWRQPHPSVDAVPRRRELIVHLGMTGQLGLDLDPDGPYARAWWALDDGTTLTFRDVRRFGRIAVVPAGDHRSLPTLHAIGPEPFDPAFTPESLWRALHASTARVKTQLLSQRPVAGVGNIYADEALWRAEVNPAARRVGRARAARLHEGIRDALALGLANGGTTLRDYRTVTGEPGRNQAALACYGRSGLPCLRCGTTLRHAVLDGRTATWCPRCQAR
jgi:formamidopyrimidine-DNA glycosylase